MRLYDREKLVKLFDIEKILDVKADIYEYQTTLSTTDKKFLFSLYVNIHEDLAAFSFEYKEPIFNIELHNLSKIECKQNKLEFYQENQEKPLLIVTVKPMISFSCKL